DYRTSDDAGVYWLDETRALVQTVDFFTPIVDDPFVYGQIAAANALSDVYAMGGRPLTALAIAAFPLEADPAILKEIFTGGLDKLAESNVALLGGHTVKDSEIKFGYAITGEVNPRRVLANAGARPGDILLLTKAIGTGVITTALKFSRAPQEAIAAAVRSMTTLNRAAAEVLRQAQDGAVRACTDVTGFGLIGHASEIAAASGCSLEIESARVPIIPGARALVAANLSGGARTNRAHFNVHVSVAGPVEPELLDLLYDPQTSGGLLVAIDPSHVDSVSAAFAAAGVSAVRVGRALAQGPARIAVV
ncbi:MAG: selenide, water dikinase SelD, partial [Acidobacteriota bacterium]